MISPIAFNLVLAATIIGSIGALFLKIGSRKFTFNILAFIKNYKLIIGFILYGSSSIFFLAALRFGELSIIYPLVALSYVFVSIFSVWFLKEKMNKFKIIGIVLIIIGVSLISIS